MMKVQPRRAQRGYTGGAGEGQRPLRLGLVLVRRVLQHSTGRAPIFNSQQNRRKRLDTEKYYPSDPACGQVINARRRRMLNGSRTAV